MAFPSTDYLRFAAVFWLFLLPGWLASGSVVGPRRTSSLVVRLPLALFLSYLLYGWIGLFCRAVSATYGLFFALFGLFTVVTALHWWRAATKASWMGCARLWRENALVLVSLLLSLAFFAFPHSDDQGLWDFNVLESLEQRSFAASALDVLPFGLEVPQPRMQANLFHVGFALFGAASDVSPIALLYYVAPPFLGVFLLLALTAFVSEVAGPRVDKAWALAAVLAPITLFCAGASPYWYEFRVINSPTLDKDFAAFFLLPVVLWLTWRYLLSGAKTFLALLVLALPVCIWTHPVTPIYSCLGQGVLAAALLHRSRLGRAIAVGGVAVAGVVLCLVTIDPGSTHVAIQELARIDLEAEGGPHFWRGHYTTPGQHQHSSIEYTPAGSPLFRQDQFFDSGLIQASRWLMLPWIALYLMSCLRARAPRWPLAWLTASGVFAWGGTQLLAVAELRLLPILIAVGAAAASLALLLAAIAAWHEPDTDAEKTFEARALRVQCLYMALLGLLYAGGTAILQYAPELYRGLERLHWVYFGFFPFVFLAHRGLAGTDLVLARLSGGQPTTSFVRAWPALRLATPLILVSLHVIDQTWAATTRGPTGSSRLGIGRSAVDDRNETRLWNFRHNLARILFQREGDRGAAVALARPPWLRDGDAFVRLHPRPFDYWLTPYKLALAKQAAYHRELYSEAYAFQWLGDDFLRWFRAYNDGVDGRASRRFVSWLDERGVTVIATRNPELIARLIPVWPHPVREIDRYLNERFYRIRDPIAEAPASNGKVSEPR